MNKKTMFLFAAYLVNRGIPLNVIEDILDWIENNVEK